MTSRSSIDRIKESVSLPTLIGEYVALRASGPDFTGLCPFHEEKTPSLRVHLSYFKCFGCGVAGDAITFLSLIDGVSSGDAMRILSERTGIPLDGPRPTRVQRAYDAQEAAFTEWWWKRLVQHLALSLSAAVALLDDVTTEEQCEDAGWLWRSVAGLKGEARHTLEERRLLAEKRRALCERTATPEERREWVVEREELKEMAEMWMACAKWGYR